MASFKDVTAIIKNFLREPYMYECVASLKKNYPDISIIVLDDGYITEEKRLWAKNAGIQYIEKDFDIGLCRARNILIQHVKTPYVLVGDDDFFYTPYCGLEKLLKLMDIADIAAGAVVENGEYKNYEGKIRRTDDGGLKWTGFEPCFEEYKGIRHAYIDVAYNFYIAKAKKIGGLWDENIKVAYEHSDFFLSAKACGLITVFCPDANVIHKSPHVKFDPSEEYAKFRTRKEDKEHFFKKWGAEYYEDMQGRREENIWKTS